MGYMIRWPGSIAGLITLVSLWTGCSKDETTAGTDHIVGSGRLVSDTRMVPAFDGIQVTNFGKVYITQDTVESLRIESDDNIIGRVRTTVNNGVLVVGLENGSYSNVTVNVYASMRRIRSLESVGAADFLSSTPVHPDTIVCRITGAGSIALSGTADEESVEIVGAGNVRNFGLESSHCFVSISGTGNVEVTATRQLDALIAGTGSIVYGGNPAVVHQIITGIGSIQPRP